MISEKGTPQNPSSLFGPEGLLHRLADGFSYGIWFVDGEGRTVFANDALAAMLGCTPEEMKSAPLDEFLFPEERETIMKAIRNGAIVRGRSRRLSLRRGNGTDRWFRMEVVPTHAIPEAPTGAFVMLSETTSERHAEEASAYLTTLVANSEDAIYGVDLDNVITSWNRGAEQVFGYAYGEAVGRSADMLGPADRPGQIEAIREMIIGGHAIEGMIVDAVRKDGTRIEVSLSGTPVYDANDRVVGYSKVARDVTARQRAAETQTRLAAIVESSDDAIVSKDLDGRILTWNPGAERVFGYSASEAIGQSVRFLIPEERQHEEDLILETLRRGERIDHFLTVRKHKDGRLIDVFVTASPIRNMDGAVVGIAKIARDVTDRMAERRERDQRIAELERYVEEHTTEWETLPK